MTETTEKAQIKTPRRKTLKGHVVSDKMARTIVVAVSRRKRHSRYGKVINSTKKYLAHDGKEEAGPGDFVMIEETRPLSKLKRWRLLKILEKAR
jgi:small subunit ribosomal protein S17